MTEPDEDFAPDDHLAPDERDIEAPAADAMEQATLVDPADGQLDVHRGLEVDEWDALEQARVVDLDDEYR
ncbi:hypothetical protein [Phytohabitans rumicis]|uniref:DUF5709 domain-containing protein n=1 Tax=Phytohabitans rumicis TaxID=1076125 RepID=A0A6V8L8K0_9ACTN|nr:hypothetical protein [Phytohabitans rumicis]GFJ90436.1 hypothetical protein Prum_040780 [Phytohabitans rumicis]